MRVVFKFIDNQQGGQTAMFKIQEVVEPKNIIIFDTTLRDGEQSPGASMTAEEKLRVAHQLVRLGVDVIEAGFAAASSGEEEAIARIAGEICGPTICSLARAKESDIKKAFRAIKNAPKKRIHTFHSTSDIHLKHQEKISREEALRLSVEMVRFARSLVEDVEFSPMDATRTDLGYLCEVIEAVIEAGATTINIPDTVGYILPFDFADIIRAVISRVKNIRQAVVSAHCHNDLGMAVANSYAAVMSGARQIECTINGIGERAGNASLEEIVMALLVHKNQTGVVTNINTAEIYRTSRLVSRTTGITVQPNKAIVGANAFAHEAGIHQHGLIEDRETYEIIDPKSVGVSDIEFVLGKHSGTHAVKEYLKGLGYGEVANDKAKEVLDAIKALADKKKRVLDSEVTEIASAILGRKEGQDGPYSLISLSYSGKSRATHSVDMVMKVRGEEVRASYVEEDNGPVNAAYKAILRAIGIADVEFADMNVRSITGGTDALGEVVVHLKRGEREYRGHGSDTDIIVAAAKAFIDALNRTEMNGAQKVKPA